MSDALLGRPGYVPESAPRATVEKPRASWGYRAGATLIDFAISLAPGLLVDHYESADSPFAAITMIGTWVLNVVVLASLNGGRTIGKLVAGTRIARADGEPYGFGRALLRDVVCRLMYVIPFFFVVDSLTPLAAHRMTIRDRMTGTLVIKEPVYRARRWSLAIASLLAAGALVGASYGVGIFSDEYSDYDRRLFVDSCQEEGLSRSRCVCAWDNIVETVEHGDFVRADRQRDPEDMDPDVRRAIQAAFEACQR